VDRQAAPRSALLGKELSTHDQYGGVDRVGTWSAWGLQLPCLVSGVHCCRGWYGIVGKPATPVSQKIASATRAATVLVGIALVADDNDNGAKRDRVR